VLTIIVVVVILVVAIASVAGWFLAPLAVRKFSERRLERRCREKRSIVLTYDDGPGKSLTPALMELLSKHRVKATFFALGFRAEEKADTIRKIVEAGHELGSHTQRHLHAWKAGPTAVIDDIRRGRATIAHLGGNLSLFRPTYGKLTLGSLIWTVWRRIVLCWWTVDTRDSWAPRDIADVVAEIVRKGGGIELMHDHESYSRVQGMTEKDRADYVLAMTTAIIALAAERQFTLLRYSDLLDIPAIR